MDILLVSLIVAAIWLWWSSAQSRESAVVLARNACTQCKVQLLDETVTLSKVGLKRNNRGHVSIARTYNFEFSTTGANRRGGVIELLGKQLLSMHLDVDKEELPV